MSAARRSAARAPAPRLVLGICSLELPVRTTRDRALGVVARFHEPESLAVALVKGLEAGAEAVLAPPGTALRAAIAALGRTLPVIARLPLVPPSEDLRWEPSLAVDADDAQAWGAAAAMLPRPGDLASRVGRRLERDAGLLPPKVCCGAAIAAEVTDLALAAGNARFFERTLRTARGRFGLAGFETRNLGHLLGRLGEWGIAPDFVLGAINAAGLGMKPDPLRVLAALANSGIPVLATELRAGGTLPLELSASFALERGAWGLVPELVDLDDVPGDLRAMSSLLAARPA